MDAAGSHSDVHGDEWTTSPTPAAVSTTDLDAFNPPLTIKISSHGDDHAKKSLPFSPSLPSPLVSPPSSAFVSALQSPYISPRVNTPPLLPPPAAAPVVLSSTTSFSASHSDEVPSTSYTPPTERFDSSDDFADQKHKLAPAATAPDPVLPRFSFSFPVPRISFAKGAVSPTSCTKFRSCDVYIGFHGQNPNLVRFSKWLKSELELHGIASFVADRARYSETQSHEIADRIICSATFGVVIVTASSFASHLSMEEIRFFVQKKNLIPLLFDIDLGAIANLPCSREDDREWREAMEGLMLKCHEFKLEAVNGSWRNCVSRAVGILKAKLGRKNISVSEKENLNDSEEIPFPKNLFFVGREKELGEIDASLFGCEDCAEIESPNSKPTRHCGSNESSEGFADEERDAIRVHGGRFINMEMRKCKEPSPEAWIDPVIELTGKGRVLHKQRSKHKRPKNGGNSKGYASASVVCINGISGMGKTELALEFAHRYRQRYKLVLWVGGESRYFRQNILNLSLNLGLDVSAEAEKERGRIRSFDEQEFYAFQRVKKELFRDIPYLLIIDNLETEEEWWEGRDLHDLIPRNTGATHVIITTRLSKVMSFEPLQLPALSPADAMALLKGNRRKDYSTDDLEVLKKFDERMGRLSYGLGLVGSLLSELTIAPSDLFEAINKISIGGDHSCSLSRGEDDHFFQSHPFLMKSLEFSSAALDHISKGSVAKLMLLAGAWFAPAPVSMTLLAAAAKKTTDSEMGFPRWRKCLGSVFCCFSNFCFAAHSRKGEAELALFLEKLGLARRTSKQPGCWIQFHKITQIFAKRRGGLSAARAAVKGVGSMGIPVLNSDHLWASSFLVFGFKSEPPLVHLKALDMFLFVKKTALPLAIQSFTTFSRCNSALELLKVCTNVLEEVEKSFVTQIQDWGHESSCWKIKFHSSGRVNESVWKDVTLLKATLLETRAKLLLRGGHFDSGEELCRTCVSIRTVMLGHNHPQTLSAQETLAKLVRLRSKI